MRPFRDQPISRKVTLLILGASIAVLLLAAAGLVFYEVSTVQPRVLRDLRAQADLLRTNTAAALTFDDARAARENLATLRVKSEIRSAALYRADGGLFAAYRRDESSNTAPAQRVPPDGARVHGRLISFVRPVFAEGERIGSLALWYELPPLPIRLLGYMAVVLAVLVTLLSVAVLMHWLLRTKLSRPLLELASTARAITERGDYRVRAVKHGDDEIGRLTDALNTMLDTIEARDVALQQSSEQLAQSQKTEAIGRLAGGIAHDFNNLLTAILGYARFALATLPPDARARDDVQQIEEAGTRAAALTSQLLAYARRQMIVPTTIDLNRVVGGMEELLRRLLGEDVTLVTRYEADLWPVRVDAGQLEQVILNLAINARDAMPTGGTLLLETWNATFPGQLNGRHPDIAPGEYAALAVRDTGTGMDDAVRARLFEPFFTTKEQGKGTGLGLAVCYGIVKQAEGHITVDSALDAGSTFTVYLPRDLTQVPVPAAASPEAPPNPRGHETILVVEDDAAVRALAVRGLRELGYTVLEAPDGATAERVAVAYDHEIDLLLVDVVMPDMDGNETAERLIAMRPALRVVFMSGYTDHPAIRRGLRDDTRTLIRKPFAGSQLARLIRSALDAPAARR